MAGSYNHVIDEDGSLSSPEDVVDMLDTRGDVYEAIEEMYGMIWFLAQQSGDSQAYATPKEAVTEAQVFYKEGLLKSPTKRYK